MIVLHFTCFVLFSYLLMDNHQLLFEVCTSRHSNFSLLRLFQILFIPSLIDVIVTRSIFTRDGVRKAPHPTLFFILLPTYIEDTSCFVS